MAAYVLGNWPELTTYVLGSLLVIGLSVVYVLQRRRFGWRASLLLVAVAGFLPLLTPAGLITCDEAEALGPLKVTLAAILMLVAIWGQPLVALLGLILWLVTTTSNGIRLPSTCLALDGQIPKQSLAIGVVMIAVAVLSNRRYQSLRLRDRLDRIEREEIRVAAEAAATASSHLSGKVDGANDLLRRIAAGEPCDERMRHRLLILDGQIRTAIQIDPGRQHGFGELCLELVDVAATLGKAITVYALMGSGDERPLPREVFEHLLAVVEAGPSSGMTLRGLGDGRTEYLTLTLPCDAESVHRLVLGEVYAEADGSLWGEALEPGETGPLQIGYFLQRMRVPSE